MIDKINYMRNRSIVTHSFFTLKENEAELINSDTYNFITVS